MSKKTNEYYLYLAWPRYLAQWFAHEMYRLQHLDDEFLEPYFYDCDRDARQLEPVHTRRGSAERNILEMCIDKQPDRIPALPPKDTTICLVIPCFLNRPPQTYNYLAPASQRLLKQTVQKHFKLELTKYINKILFVPDYQYRPTKDQLIEAFMQKNGIEYSETNVETIKKIWKRLYNTEYKHSKQKPS